MSENISQADLIHDNPLPQEIREQLKENSEWFQTYGDISELSTPQALGLYMRHVVFGRPIPEQPTPDYARINALEESLGMVISDFGAKPAAELPAPTEEKSAVPIREKAVNKVPSVLVEKAQTVAMPHGTEHRLDTADDINTLADGNYDIDAELLDGLYEARRIADFCQEAQTIKTPLALYALWLRQWEKQGGEIEDESSNYYTERFLTPTQAPRRGLVVPKSHGAGALHLVAVGSLTPVKNIGKYIGHGEVYLLETDDRGQITRATTNAYKVHSSKDVDAMLDDTQQMKQARNVLKKQIISARRTSNTLPARAATAQPSLT